jgi:hypothetical protein
MCGIRKHLKLRTLKFYFLSCTFCFRLHKRISAAQFYIACMLRVVSSNENPANVTMYCVGAYCCLDTVGEGKAGHHFCLGLHVNRRVNRLNCRKSEKILLVVLVV